MNWTNRLFPRDVYRTVLGQTTPSVPNDAYGVKRPPCDSTIPLGQTTPSMPNDHLSIARRQHTLGQTTPSMPTGSNDPGFTKWVKRPQVCWVGQTTPSMLSGSNYPLRWNTVLSRVLGVRRKESTCASAVRTWSAARSATGTTCCTTRRRTSRPTGRSPTSTPTRSRFCLSPAAI